MLDWSKYPNFKKSEFDCKETGENGMTHAFMFRLQALRGEYGKPMIVNSGFRSVKHSIEARKAKGGTHTKGIAADIRADGKARYEIAELAFKYGFTGIGIHKNFIHLDIATNDDGFARPWLWNY